MSDFFDSLFSKKSIFIVAVVLLVAVGLVYWDFKFMELFTGSTQISGLDLETADGIGSSLAFFGVGAVVTAIFSVLVICNVLLWMLPCLFKALMCLIGAIPIVNIFFSAELRADLSEAFDEWVTPKTHLSFDPFSLFLIDVVEEESGDFLVHFIVSTIFSCITGILGCIFYIVAAVGIPLFCPLVTVLAMSSILMVTANPIWLAVIGLVCFGLVGFVFIGIPVISLVRK